MIGLVPLRVLIKGANHNHSRQHRIIQEESPTTVTSHIYIYIHGGLKLQAKSFVIFLFNTVKARTKTKKGSHSSIMLKKNVLCPKVAKTALRKVHTSCCVAQVNTSLPLQSASCTSCPLRVFSRQRCPIQQSCPLFQQQQLAHFSSQAAERVYRCLYCSAPLMGCGELSPLRCAGCKRLQPSQHLSLTHFELLNDGKVTYDVDLGQIRRRALILQRHLHPDQFRGELEDAAKASDWSAHINRSFEVLKSDILRAIYLVFYFVLLLTLFSIISCLPQNMKRKRLVVPFHRRN